MNRQKLEDAMKERDRMEKRMKEIISYLNQPGENGVEPVGLHGNLLDKDGFPRDDIDIITIRNMRHELAELRTDYEKLTDSLTDMTYAAFEEIREHPELFEHKSSPSVQQEEIKKEDLKSKKTIEKKVELSEEVDVEDDPLLAAVKAFEEQQATVEDWLTPEEYFGSIRTVQPKSLADSYGLMDCDRFIQFGEITIPTFKDLKQFGEYFEKSRGKEINIIIGRNRGDHYEKRTIKMHIPKDTSQRLGIHFIPNTHYFCLFSLHF